MMKKILSLVLVLMMLSSVAFAASFTDFNESHWAYPYVDELVANGVVNGYEDGSYRPEANVTRAELAKLLSLQFGESTEKSYSDVLEGDWFYDYVTVSGSYFLAEGTFNPNTPATREEVAYAIYMAKNLNAPAAPATFTDAADIAAVYQNAVAAVAEKGIITGYPDGSFAPKNNITRAEVATVLSRAIKLDTNEALYQEVFKMAKLLETSYDANAVISYGKLSSAALRMFNNEYKLAYYNLGEVVGKRPFEHEDALSFWIIGRDVLGADIVTLEKIDTPISVKEAIDVMAFFAEKHDFLKRTVDKTKLLVGADLNAPLNNYRFAQLITEIDMQIPMLVRVDVTHANTANKIPTEIRKDLATYPANRVMYQAILEEIPNSVYEAAYSLQGSAVGETYDFAREMMSFLLGPINEMAKIAQYNGAEIQVSYYPSLVVRNNNVYVIRAKMEILSAKDGLKLNDVCNTKIDRPIKAGDTFFCDINTNVQVPSTALNGGVLTIDAIYE
ncbi:MAG: S-layer homology domain-containing protein [Clostridia bacterium]|nr:S-layer homology domain-containing protein [Clostridia bacterium]